MHDEDSEGKYKTINIFIYNSIYIDKKDHQKVEIFFKSLNKGCIDSKSNEDANEFDVTSASKKTPDFIEAFSSMFEQGQDLENIVLELCSLDLF